MTWGSTSAAIQTLIRSFSQSVINFNKTDINDLWQTHQMLMKTICSHLFYCCYYRCSYVNACSCTADAITNVVVLFFYIFLKNTFYLCLWPRGCPLLCTCFYIFTAELLRFVLHFLKRPICNTHCNDNNHEHMYEMGLFYKNINLFMK